MSESARARPVTVGPLQAADRASAAVLLARSMDANPTHVAVFGAASGSRPQVRHLFTALLRRGMAQGVVFGAWRGDDLVGVLGATRPGGCRLGPLASLRLAAAALPGLSPVAAWRLWRWRQAWERAHPCAPHWHMGPYAVDPRHRGRVGPALAQACMAHPHIAMEPAYLETDTPRNVRLYRHFGFRVIGTGRVLGVPQWFMWRGGASRTAAASSRSGS